MNKKTDYLKEERDEYKEIYKNKSKANDYNEEDDLQKNISEKLLNNNSKANDYNEEDDLQKNISEELKELMNNIEKASQHELLEILINMLNDAEKMNLVTSYTGYLEKIRSALFADVEKQYNETLETNNSSKEDEPQKNIYEREILKELMIDIKNASYPDLLKLLIVTSLIFYTLITIVVNFICVKSLKRGVNVE